MSYHQNNQWSCLYKGNPLSFPEIPPDQSVSQWCESQFGIEVEQQEIWPETRYTFSHFHLDITPVLATTAQNNPNRVMDQEHWVWYKGSGVTQGGMAAPIKRLIAKLEKHYS